MNRLKILLLLLITLSLLTACGAGNSQTPPAAKSASNAAVNIKKPAPSIHDQVSTIAQQEERTRNVKKSTLQELIQT